MFLSRRLLLAAAPAAVALRSAPGFATPPPARLYKSPLCDCCEEYAAYLRAAGHAVQVIATHDLPLIKRQNRVPPALEGCHTTLIGGYVVEGHVPLAVLARLLAERPAIPGVSLPGMPLGSPGMTGRKTEPFVIYALPRDLAAAPTVYAVV